MSKRQYHRKKRAASQRNQRLIFIGIIAAFAILIAVLLIAPTFQATGTVVQGTPRPRPPPAAQP
ncbi:MAG: hypothetical protein IT308_11190, partial [Anaerolineaceae bacterium]|nr:hypothetical protein [Anaerolineaceae bacterium]